jgi:ureidoacrylate peracid hydrolase
MQNAFVNKGGMSDLSGSDILSVQQIVNPIRRIRHAAREKGVKVIYTAHRYSADLHDSGGPNSAAWYKAKSLKVYRQHPEWRDRLLIRGTWGADIIAELEPQDQDVVVEKTYYSAFFGTNLDIILRTHDVKYLIFAGVATNICVEATIRDAYYLGYFPILVSDAAASIGPSALQDATIFNVSHAYGWVTTTRNILNLLLNSENIQKNQMVR